MGAWILSADSMLVYRGMDIGTAKPSRGEIEEFHMGGVDLVTPAEPFSSGAWLRAAAEWAKGVPADRPIVIVGGTGLYVDSVADGYVLTDKATDLALRAELETRSTPELYEMLKEKLPDTDVDPKNRHRVMRLLEKLAAGDAAPGTKSPRYSLLKLGVTWPREILKQRIDERLERRLQQGMVDEVKSMLDDGVSEEFLVKLGLEYKYLTWYLTGKIGYEQMVEELGSAIKRFAKRQMTWFRRDPRIIWLDMKEDPVSRASELITDFLGTGA